MKVYQMITRMICIVALISCLPSTLMAELTLGSLFQDNMVLQRDMAVPIWGTGDPGATVTLEFSGQKKDVVATADGKWQVTLDPMPASFEPGTLTVHSTLDTRHLTLSNVVIGEVWICSGQSNMQLGHSGIPNIKALIPEAKNIRSFEVKRTVALEEQGSCQGKWSEQVPGSAVAFTFAYFLEKAAEVPVGIILTCWGSSSLEAWMPRDMTQTVPHFKTMMKTFDADTKMQGKIKAILAGPKPWSKVDDIFLRRQSNILYNAMMHPLVPYACRGLVWYQGERNTYTMFGDVTGSWFAHNSGILKYGDTLSQWIRRYRKAWANDEMQFLVVMLPGYYKSMTTGPQLGPEHPDTHSWAWMRESQMKVLDLPYTSVANTIDLGDMRNIHPKDKLPVGQRLALLAARDTLGHDVEAQGPVMKKVKRKGDKLVVTFKYDDGLKTNDGETPKGFWLADDSAQWVKAEAVLDGQKVELRSPELEKPLYVRYAFVGMPKVNLVNGAGLPVYPFRTDRFEPSKAKEGQAVWKDTVKAKKATPPAKSKNRKQKKKL